MLLSIGIKKRKRKKKKNPAVSVQRNRRGEQQTPSGEPQPPLHNPG
jgi:hypothetical protein